MSQPVVATWYIVSEERASALSYVGEIGILTTTGRGLSLNDDQDALPVMYNAVGHIVTQPGTLEAYMD